MTRLTTLLCHQCTRKAQSPSCSLESLDLENMAMIPLFRRSGLQPLKLQGLKALFIQGWLSGLKADLLPKPARGIGRRRNGRSR
jgi:hypothetical protein